MALGPRLDLRQTQSLVMTPQLQQAIKLLALSNLEIESFIGDALEANPLLELGESRHENAEADKATDLDADAGSDIATSDELITAGAGETDQPLDIDVSALDRDRDTGEWSAQAGGGVAEPGVDFETRLSEVESLASHLRGQIGVVCESDAEEFICHYLVGLIDDTGYLNGSIGDIAQDLSTPPDQVEAALAKIQQLEPVGVGARSLAECIALQAKDADRYDPCMACMIENLDLVAKGNFAQLKRICRVDDQDLAEMLVELRGYDPKPGLQIGGQEQIPITPDILLSPGKDGAWDIRINEATLPRLVVNRDYYLELKDGAADKASQAWLNEKLTDANWMIKALDQRQKTILKVAGELVKQQGEFFRQGVSALRPLTLKTVADAIEMHESTVSRVTSNKYLYCDRGTFELKYFFTSGVGASDSEVGASSEAVKARIKDLIDAEEPKKILSDDKLVEMLRAEGFDLARRTVAKYREALGIGSSVQRRREKKLRGMA